MGRKGGNRGNYNDQGFSQPHSSGQAWGSGYRQPAQQPQQSSRQGAWGSGFAAGAPAGQNRFGALANSNTQTNGGNAEHRSPRGGQQQVSWRKTVEEDVLGPWRMWPLSCYAHTATNPGPVKNDVEGTEMSMEELHWQDLQAIRAGQSGQSLQQAFQAAAAQQKQLFQALARADKPPTLGGPPVSPAAFGGGDLKPGFGGQGAFGSEPQQPSPFGGAAGATTFGAGAQPATAFGKPAGPFGSQAAPITFGNPGASGASQSAPAFGAAARPQSPFGANPPAPTAQPSPFGAQTDPAQAPSAFGTPTASSPGAAGRSDPSNGSPWAAQFFERGKIPDDPPPLEVCG
ncbi:hypothetical protein WJX84_002034 [Apatococcus fuscideae]|uniref:Uncharacterized protein n=1 Tax=Apatococcus fuscideae TaxID=2026836 RepID=A0AAW1SIC8_9CHLO